MKRFYRLEPAIDMVGRNDPQVVALELFVDRFDGKVNMDLARGYVVSI